MRRCVYIQWQKMTAVHGVPKAPRLGVPDLSAAQVKSDCRRAFNG